MGYTADAPFGAGAVDCSPVHPAAEPFAGIPARHPRIRFVAGYPFGMSFDDTDPEPDPRAPGGGVPPGETPPAESSTGSGTGPRQETSRGWATGPLLIILIVAAVFAAFFLVYAITLML